MFDSSNTTLIRHFIVVPSSSSDSTSLSSPSWCSSSSACITHAARKIVFATRAYEQYLLYATFLIVSYVLALHRLLHGTMCAIPQEAWPFPGERIIAQGGCAHSLEASVLILASARQRKATWRQRQRSSSPVPHDEKSCALPLCHRGEGIVGFDR